MTTLNTLLACGLAGLDITLITSIKKLDQAKNGANPVFLVF